jgi:hypothetical protein
MKAFIGGLLLVAVLAVGAFAFVLYAPGAVTAADDQVSQRQPPIKDCSWGEVKDCYRNGGGGNPCCSKRNG